MDRRTFMKAAGMGAAIAGVAGSAAAAEVFYPTKVDPKLFETINRVKDPANKTALEKSHAPVINAPDKIKAGEPFEVEISVGEKLHVMTQPHWIELIELAIGNEPAGTVELQNNGYLQPRATFNVVLSKDAAPDGKVTLVAHQRCNLHGYWEGTKDIIVG